MAEMRRIITSKGVSSEIPAIRLRAGRRLKRRLETEIDGRSLGHWAVAFSGIDTVIPPLEAGRAGEHGGGSGEFLRRLSTIKISICPTGRFLMWSSRALVSSLALASHASLGGTWV